jgi:hypothetical protein
MARNISLWKRYVQNEAEFLKVLSEILNTGQLSLMLGAGASKALNLPDWKALVTSCMSYAGIPGTVVNMTPEELKKVIDQVKAKYASETDYHEAIREMLYNGLMLDFNTAKKELLMALSSLIVGKKRGNVSQILTYNFDSLLEWYLEINGLKVRVLSEKNILRDSVDVELIHNHGYLPHKAMTNHQLSNFLIFSRKEFEARKIEPDNFWKLEMYRFFKSTIFLSVGVSPSTMLEDISDYLAFLDKWYKKEKIERDKPYGFAIFSKGSVTTQQVEDLFENGIISLEKDKAQIPQTIFNISQIAAGINISFTL